MPAASYNELMGLGSHSEDPTLKGWWPLLDNDLNTTVLDQSSNGNHGTLVGGANTQDLISAGPNSWLSSSLLFAGANYISTPYNGTPTDFTFLSRGKSNGWTNFSRLMDKGSSAGFFLSQGGSAGIYATAVKGSAVFSINLTDSVWHNFAGRRAGSTAYIISGASENSIGTSAVALDTAALYIGAPSSGQASLRWRGNLSEQVAFERALSDAEEAEWEAGPEPVNTVVPTLTINGTSWTGTVGTWGLPSPFASGSNGTVTYEWELRDAGNAVIDSGTGSSPSGVGSFAGGYYLWVRASNSGGYDSGADSVSSPAAVPLDESLVTTLVMITSTLTATEGALSTAPIFDFYGTLEGSTTYFNTLLHRTDWANTAAIDRKRALVAATQRIDLFNFIGDKTDPDQTKEFPRTVEDIDIDTPTDIEIATYEIAYSYLQGRDPDKDIRELTLSSFAFANVRQGYNRDFLPEHLLAGVPSSVAWAKLKPYFRDPLTNTLLRG